MFGQKCSNCGYQMGLGESLLNNFLKIVKDTTIPQSLVGTNTISNANNLKCPYCGAVGRWIRDDE
ncbi:UNVERIFIED_CONTAM: DNA-directed RNA polymerase subunit RPC12/RpoP [Brevibacillus sp. OAP136]